MEVPVAKNKKPPGDGRIGVARERSQTKMPDRHWVKRNDETGRLMDIKTSDEKPFKGVRKEK
jgi:hypothetical protein